MKILLRALAVVLVAIGVFLIYAVIHAVSSDNGARAGVAVAYVVAAILLGFLASWLWRRATTAGAAGPDGPTGPPAGGPPPGSAV